MKTFKTKRFLIAIILILLLIDGVVLGFFIVRNKPETSEKPHTSKSAIQDVLKKEVKFTETQIAQFQKVREQEFDSLRPLFGKVKKAKDNFYGLLYTAPVNDSLLLLHADLIGLAQKQLDLQMFSYFKQIRQLCTEDQLPKFDSSMKKVIMRMTGRKNKDHHDSSHKSFK